MTRARSFLTQVQHHGGATLVGPHAIVTAQQTLSLAMRELGVAIVFDPGSAPDLVDALGVPAADAIQFAAAGATLGLLIGVFAGNPAAWAGAGALVGSVGGAARGAQRVREGWRVRAVRDARGMPHISISRGSA